MSFWEVVWFIIISFAFVAYLMVLFSILGDLFRDRGTSGFVKTVWIIALIVFPFLSALIYLIARGSGMAERSAREAAVEAAYPLIKESGVRRVEGVRIWLGGDRFSGQPTGVKTLRTRSPVGRAAGY